MSGRDVKELTEKSEDFALIVGSSARKNQGHFILKGKVAQLSAETPTPNSQQSTATPLPIASDQISCTNDGRKTVQMMVDPTINIYSSQCKKHFKHTQKHSDHRTA